MEKLNPYESYKDTDTKLLQVLYLKNVIQLAIDKIAEITGYAISTIKTYCSKFKHLLNKAKRLFESGFKTLKKINNEIIEKHSRISKVDNRIKWDVPSINDPCGYILEFYSGKKLLWLKVGMTERPIRERIKEHLSYYGKKHFDLTCTVKQLYPTISHEGAEIAESALRECYKKNHSESFIKNDRFLNVKYEAEEKQDSRFLTFLNMVAA